MSAAGRVSAVLVQARELLGVCCIVASFADIVAEAIADNAAAAAQIESEVQALVEPCRFVSIARSLCPLPSAGVAVPFAQFQPSCVDGVPLPRPDVRARGAVLLAAAFALERRFSLALSGVPSLRQFPIAFAGL